MFGWNQKLLRINLSDKSYKYEEIPEKLLHLYIGGRGLGVKYIFDEVHPKTEPFSEENKVVISVGPLNSTVVPTSGRFTMTSKSPLTGTIFDSNSGGYFGAELKRCGVDAVIIEGKSKEPVYIYIEDEKVLFKDASHLWGKDTHDTQKIIKEETNKKARVSCIGPAGENMVLLAAVMNDNDRACGRGGLGAIWGYKNLKAIAVKGSKKIEVSDRKALNEIVSIAKRTIDKNSVTGKGLQVLGTSILVNVINAHGMYPTRNFQEGVFNDAEGVSGEKLAERFLVDTSACFNCPIKCGRVTQTPKEKGDGPEYESLWAFTAQCGVNDLEAAVHANYMCNKLGMDTISVGNTIGCAMELAEKGYLDYPIKFGDAEKMLQLVEETAYKKGLGEKIALGSRRLAESYGAPHLAMQMKGLEIPAYDPRGTQGHALAYATSNRGGCHMRAYLIQTEILGLPCFMDRFSTKGKAEVTKFFQDFSAVVDSLNLCRFTQIALGVDYYQKFFNYTTGLNYTEEQLVEVGERIYNLERYYNSLVGFSRKDDILPDRFLKEPFSVGGSRGRVVHLDEMLDEYYKLRGWDENGVPLKETLVRLQIIEE